MSAVLCLPACLCVSTAASCGQAPHGNASVLHLLTIFGFLPAIQLKHARTSPITVGRVVASTLIVRRTTVKEIRGPFPPGGGGLSHVLRMPTTTLPRIRVGWRPPPSRSLLSSGLPSLMLAHILIHLGVVPPLHADFDQQMDQVTIRVRQRFSLRCLSAVLPCRRRNVPQEPQIRLCRPIGRGVHTPHELFQLRNEH